MIRSKIFSFLILFPFIISAQSFPESGDDIGSLIPEGYILKDLNFGDLNSGANEDLIMVVRDKLSNQKSIAIYQKEGFFEWALVTQSNNFFLQQEGDIFVPEYTTYQDFNDRVRNEEYVKVNINNGIISVYTGDGYGNWIETKFRKIKNNQYALIGLTVGSYFRNEQTETSINYLTSKAQRKTELIGEGLEGNTETWYKIDFLDPPYFQDFTMGEIMDDLKNYKYKKIGS